MPLYLVLSKIFGAYGAESTLYTPIIVFYCSFEQFKAVLSSFHTFRKNFLKRRLRRRFRAFRAGKPATLPPPPEGA